MLRLKKSGNSGRMRDTSKGSMVSTWSGRSMFHPEESCKACVFHALSSIVVVVAAAVVVRCVRLEVCAMR
jgi:hypothetical protein